MTIIVEICLAKNKEKHLYLLNRWKIVSEELEYTGLLTIYIIDIPEDE